MCYLQVLMHTHRHLIQVQILNQSDLGAFSYKIDTSFFLFFSFERILHLFLEPLYMLCTSLHAKTPILDLGQNS